MLERSFVSLRDGDRPVLTPLGDSPLLSPSLASAPNSSRSTYEAWKAGTLTKASLVDIAPSDSIAAYFSAQPRSTLGSFSRSCLCSLWKVSRVPLSGILPAGSTACTTSSTPTVSSLRARSRSPCRMKKPLVLLRPRGNVSSVVTGAPPGSLSARCVVFTVSPCLIIFSLFPRPLTIDPAGRTGVMQVGRWYSGWYAACYASGYSSWYGYYWGRALDWNAGCLRTRRELRPLWLFRLEDTWTR